MKITPDTNVLIRAFIEHDPEQSRVAQAALAEAVSIALTLPALCELVWVLSRSYKRSTADIAVVVRELASTANVIVNRSAVDAGLAMLDAGGDFADGVIAYEGNWAGAETFVSFDRQAVKLIESRGGSARLLS